MIWILHGEKNKQTLNRSVIGGAGRITEKKTKHGGARRRAAGGNMAAVIQV